MVSRSWSVSPRFVSRHTVIMGGVINHIKGFKPHPLKDQRDLLCHTLCSDFNKDCLTAIELTAVDVLDKAMEHCRNCMVSGVQLCSLSSLSLSSPLPPSPPFYLSPSLPYPPPYLS